MGDLEQLRARVNAGGGYMRLNGMEVTALQSGFCEVRAPMGPEKTNPHGMAHGGFIFTLCDTAAGIAASSLGRNVVGRTADIHFLRPGGGTCLTARAKVIQSGRHMALSAVEVFDDADTLVAVSQVEMFFLKGEPEV